LKIAFVLFSAVADIAKKCETLSAIELILSAVGGGVKNLNAVAVV
jgi:hypothetical protein